MRLDFLDDKEAVSGVTTGGPGYVAVGWKRLPGELIVEGRVWTSVDGQSWEQQSTEMPFGLLEDVLEFQGTLFAFGHESDAQGGIGPATIWRSHDGATWVQTAELTGARGHLMSVTATDGHMYLVDSSGGHPRIWTSSDGVDWRAPAGGAPSRYYLGALGNVLVAAATDTIGSVAMDARVSLDDGQSWQDTPVNSSCVLAPYFAANDELLLAATSTCCTSSGSEFGIPLTTRDGLIWSVGAPHISTGDAAVAIPDGFAILSNDGSTAVSHDGETWFSGPHIPPAEADRGIHDATAGDTAVLFVSLDFRNAMQYDRALWYAPTSAFELSNWTEPVPMLRSR